jgi:hypothetical protein
MAWKTTGYNIPTNPAQNKFYPINRQKKV